MPTDKPLKEVQPNNKKKANSYLKYSGMATQLLVLIFIAVYLGGLLDRYFNSEQGWFTISFVIIFFCGWFYALYRDLIND